MLYGFSHLTFGQISCLILRHFKLQKEDKRKDDSKDDDETEEDNNQDEYDPMEAEEAEDEEDGMVQISLSLLWMNYIFCLLTLCNHNLEFQYFFFVRNSKIFFSKNLFILLMDERNFFQQNLAFYLDLTKLLELRTRHM